MYQTRISASIASRWFRSRPSSSLHISRTVSSGVFFYCVLRPKMIAPQMIPSMIISSHRKTSLVLIISISQGRREQVQGRKRSSLEAKLLSTVRYYFITSCYDLMFYCAHSVNGCIYFWLWLFSLYLSLSLWLGYILRVTISIQSLSGECMCCV